MESFEPLINLLVLLTILSISAERGTNLLKLRNADLRRRRKAYEDDRDREYAMMGRSVLVGVVLALLVKADFFEILTHLDSPWRTMGWVQVHDHHWTRAEATADMGSALYALAGCVITGVGLGFGSKFWHDILGSVYDLRNSIRRRQPGAKDTVPAAGAGHNDGD
jgi:hypothetical protein